MGKLKVSKKCFVFFKQLSFLYTETNLAQTIFLSVRSCSSSFSHKQKKNPNSSIKNVIFLLKYLAIDWLDLGFKTIWIVSKIAWNQVELLFVKGKFWHFIQM